ncbi:MAG: T9SS type A sorting domain-containing protein [Edaphocola sp.]
MNTSFSKHFILVAAFMAFAVGAKAQTWPSAFDLSAANYSLTGWPSSSSAGTYPTSMRFYLMANTGDVTSADTIGADYTSAYNLTSQTRITGRNDTGFSFINTGSSTAVSPNDNYKLGAAVLALNTTSRDSVTVSWKGHTVTPNYRSYLIRLYYRVGSTGAFLPVLNGTDTVQYMRSATAGDTATVGPVLLPSATWDQSLVQLEWKYYQSDTNTATGARAELSVSDISVTSVGTPLPPAPVLGADKNNLSSFLAMVGSTSASDSFKIAGTNLTANVAVTTSAPFSVSSDGTTFGTSATYVPTNDTLDSAYVYVRFSPTVAGSQSGTVVFASGTASASVTVAGYAYASTNPDAVALGSGGYSLTSWDSLATAGTYPANTVLQVTDNSSPQLVYTPLANNWYCGYNLASRSRFNGLGSNGVSFINTSSAQYDDCSSGTNTNNAYIGGIVAAVNTQNVDSAAMSFDVELLARGTDSISREYALRLQVRTDSVSSFTDVDPLLEFSSLDKAVGDQTHFSFNLPATLLGKDYVEFRWLYYDLNVADASGSRPQFRLDEVSIQKLSTTSVNNITNDATDIVIFPNPLNGDKTLHFSEPFSGSVYDLTGRVLLRFQDAASINVEKLPAGTYFIKAGNGSVAKISIL